MAVNGPGTIYDLTMGGAIRAGGNLAATSVLANGNTYRERFRVGPNAASFEIRAKASGITGTPTIQAVPSTANIGGNDLTVSDAAAGLTAVTTLLTSEINHAYTPPKGETFIDVVVDTTAGSNKCTLTYVDVFVRTQ